MNSAVVTEAEALRTLLGGQGQVRLPMLSGSMAWTILPGDILTIQALPEPRVHRGDVAVFLREGVLTAHRIVFAFSTARWRLFLEMGDQNPLPRFLDPAQVLGRVVAVERGGLPVALPRGDEARRRAQKMLASGALRAVTEALRPRRGWLHG